jgi:hypothetical protein
MTMPWLAFGLLWWLRPAFDRVILHVLAGASFGAAPSLRDTWRALPRLWWGNGLLRALTIGRLDLARSFNLSVTQLERQFGKPAHQRREVLAREGRSAGVWLTIISINFEFLMVLSIYFLVLMFLPDDVLPENLIDVFMQEPSLVTQHVSNAITMLVFVLLEPFYVSAGFALYLNARTVLEGWDIELAFKRMNARVSSQHAADSRLSNWMKEKSSTVINAALGALFCLLAAAITLPQTAVANERAQPMQDVQERDITLSAQSPAPQAIIKPVTGAKERVEEVLRDPLFGEKKKKWSIKYVGPGSEEKKQKPADLAWMEAFGKFLGYFFRFLAWIIGAAAVVALLVYLLKQWQSGRWRHWLAKRDKPLEMLFGLDVRPESLPSDVAAAARACIARNDLRGALSLLYRGALVFLIQDGRINIAAGDTEGVCARQVSKHYLHDASHQKLPSYFSELVRVWQLVAYSGSTFKQGSGQTESTAVQIAQLIDDWGQHFQGLTVNDIQSSTFNTAANMRGGAA